MKKLVYTLSLVALIAIAGKAQENVEVKKQDPAVLKKQLAPSAASTSSNASEQPKSRMAITQKGIPATKEKSQENKDAKATEPKGQPAATEKH